MTTLNTINIKGKKYVTVNERLKHFRENCPGYSLETEVIEVDGDSALMRAVIRNDQNRIIATGVAREVRTDSNSMVNKTSHVENCETSAWGRALANFGIGIDENVASADEVAMAIETSSAISSNPSVFSPASLFETYKNELQNAKSNKEKESIKTKITASKRSFTEGQLTELRSIYDSLTF